MNNLIGAVSAALNGCSYCIADHREFWVKTKAGVSYPVASVCDETDTDLPWYAVYFIDYLGVKRSVADLCKASQDALFGLIVDELY